MGGFSRQPGRSGAGRSWGPARGGFRKGSAHKVCHRVDLSEGITPAPKITSARSRREQAADSVPLAAIEQALRTISEAAAGALARQAAPAPDPAAQAAPPPIELPKVDPGDPDRPWQERLHRIFRSLDPVVGGASGASDLEQAVLQVIAQEIERTQERLIEEHRGLTPAARVYERRIAKLNQALEETQDRLRRIAALRDVDQGIASIYEAVQGLDDNEEFAAFKKQLMARIFEANVKLKEAREGQV